MKIVNGTAIYTGGGCYSVIGKLDNGLYFHGCHDWCAAFDDDTRTVDKETGDLACFDNAWCEAHEVNVNQKELYKAFKDFCERLDAEEPGITRGYEKFSNYSAGEVTDYIDFDGFDELTEGIKMAGSIAKVGIYGDEVPGLTSVSSIVDYFKSNGLTVKDVSGNMDHGWEMTLIGDPRKIFFAVCAKIPGYNSDSVQDFIDEYSLDESVTPGNFKKGDVVVAKDEFVGPHETLKDTLGVVVSYNPDNDYLVIGEVFKGNHALNHTFSARGEFYRLATNKELKDFGALEPVPEKVEMKAMIKSILEGGDIRSILCQEQESSADLKKMIYARLKMVLNNWSSYFGDEDQWIDLVTSVAKEVWDEL